MGRIATLMSPILWADICSGEGGSRPGSSGGEWSNCPEEEEEEEKEEGEEKEEEEEELFR